MFKNNLTLEMKLLYRSNWLVLLVVCVFVLAAFAIRNGMDNKMKRSSDILLMEEQLHQKDSSMLSILQQIAVGEDTGISNWRLPSEPMNIGYRNPRLAVMPPEVFSYVATGQSDMYTHFKSPTVYGNTFALDYAEMVNPVQLLFGTFDVSFVIIYLLPLLIIAFTFNVLSKEKELGTLRLLGAQPISIRQWLVQKMTIRFLIFSFICLISIVLLQLLFARESFLDMSSLFRFLMLIVAYILFWFALATGINLKVNDSAKNAFALIAIWLFIIVIIPAVMNQLSATFYPTPSRLKMINEIRAIQKENEEKQSEIMDAYLKTHPEFAMGTDSDDFGFWHNYFASEKAMEAKIQPLLDRYDTQIQKQQNLLGTFAYLSPAVLMQESLNTIAGTSSKHYDSYKKQVVSFSKEWRGYLVPMLFKGQKFQLKNYDEMPRFVYQNTVKDSSVRTIGVLLLFSVLLFFLGIKKPHNKYFID